MKTRLAFILISILLWIAPYSQLSAAAITQILPWLPLSSLALGISSVNLQTARTNAKIVPFYEQESGQKFNGSMNESLPDGSTIYYIFVEDELASIVWYSTSVYTNQRLIQIRTDLQNTSGQPMIRYVPRIDRENAVAKLVCEIYKPVSSSGSVVELMASSGGIEIYLSDETIYSKYARPLQHESYDDLINKFPPSIKPSDKPSIIIDRLGIIRTAK